MGIANEQETGFPDFDERVYVTCDHPTVAKVLARDARLRKAILTALGLGEDAAHGAEGIRYDGTGIWLAVLVLWLRGSSRGHRLLVESAVMLTIGLPIASVQAVADINRLLDDAPARVVVVGAAIATSPAWPSARTMRACAIWELPPLIDVSPAICSEIGATQELQLEIAPGRWGLPWYRSMRSGGVEWISPR